MTPDALEEMPGGAHLTREQEACSHSVLGERFLYLLGQIEGMYTSAEPIQVRIYPDRWRKGRYRVQLSSQIASDLEDVDTVLGQLGYSMVDADQYGRSYHHSKNSRCTADLDELECEGGPVLLTLSRCELDEPETAAAEQELIGQYERLSKILRGYDAVRASAGGDWRDEHYTHVRCPPRRI